MSDKWRNYSDHPVVVAVTVITGVISIIVFFTGISNFPSVISMFSKKEQALSASPSPSLQRSQDTPVNKFSMSPEPAISQPMKTYSLKESEVLKDFLSINTDYRLVDNSCVLSEHRNRLEEEVNLLQPTAYGDANNDGYRDLAVILVKETFGEKLFSVVCFPGIKEGISLTPMFLSKNTQHPAYWVKIRPSEREIWFGTSTQSDAFDSYRWNKKKQKFEEYFPFDKY